VDRKSTGYTDDEKNQRNASETSACALITKHNPTDEYIKTALSTG